MFCLASAENHKWSTVMLDAILITLGITAVAFSLFYKFLLHLYREDLNTSERNKQEGSGNS
jgi:hypothetical protein